jgi:hypothetical protein
MNKGKLDLALITLFAAVVIISVYINWGILNNRYNIGHAGFPLIAIFWNIPVIIFLAVCVIIGFFSKELKAKLSIPTLRFELVVCAVINSIGLSRYLALIF